MVSIKDVAKEAGVAISTVSKVLNNYPNVSEETRRKVNDAVERLNFVPNQVAAALSSKRSGRIALLLKLNMKTQAIDEIDMLYISGALGMAQEKQLDCITVFYSMIAKMNLEEMIRYFASQNISGIVIFGMNNDDRVLHQLIDSQYFKIAVVDGATTNESTSVVGVDHYQAQMDVAEKTIKENYCKRILYIAGMRNSYVTEEKIRAMEDLCKKRKIKLFICYLINIDLVFGDIEKACAADYLLVCKIISCKRYRKSEKSSFFVCPDMINVFAHCLSP